MKMRWLTAMALGFSLTAQSQTLFTYGTHKADAKDFLRAFSKNNQAGPADKANAMRQYLDLYVNSRLKIQEAYDRRYDTLPEIKAEISNLRDQIIDNYLSDPKALDRLSREAFARSQKDIHVAHIFISLTNSSGQTDTTAARKKLEEVEKRLARGEDFGTVAAKYSDDPSAAENRGDLNYITAFTLPYALENVIYSTPAGKTSKPFTSRAGYHIFKNLGERKALGRIKIQQILLAVPPGADAAAVQASSRLADSLYKQLATGADFAKLATTYSNDLVSSIANGNVPEIAVGQYDPAFEQYIAGLTPGILNKPFQSKHGFHIVKLLEIKPVSTTADEATLEALQQKVMTDDRWKTARDFIYARVGQKPGLRRATISETALWAISDSLLDYKPAGLGRSLTPATVVFTIGKQSWRIADWIQYAQMNRYRTDRGGIKPYSELMDEFRQQAMYQYYRDHLEEYNEDFRLQMSEFTDGNLFFEIMQQEVWNKAQADSMALLSLYQKNKDHYYWKESADAILFFCPDETTAGNLMKELEKDPAGWRRIMEPLRDRVVADSSRFEWSQLPGLNGNAPKAGTHTATVINPTDNTASFAYIFKVYTTASPRSFEEAKGLVMNDYQNILEAEWIKRLRAKYPVKVNQQTLNSLTK
ncbi:MAG: hypothetical protein GXC78_10455 [Chitinophagaceae bacterium]|nr:hypothetical protein [Chitinophagaceae bacterium]